MIKKVTNDSIGQLISLAEARDFIGITRSSDTSRDAVIYSSINAATQLAENYCNVSFLNKTFEIYTDTSELIVQLEKQLISVELVSYYDSNNTIQTWTDFYIDLPSSTIIFNSFPAVYAREYPLIINHISGLGSVRDDLKRAVLHIVSSWVKQGDSVEGNIITTIPYSAIQILDQYKNWNGYFK